MRKLKGYEEEEKYGCYDFGMMRSMVKIAVPSTLQQSIVHMGILLVQSVVNSFGSAALAGYSAGSRIESLSIVPCWPWEMPCPPLRPRILALESWTG